MQMLALSSKMTLAPHCQAKFTSPPLLFSASNFFCPANFFSKKFVVEGDEISDLHRHSLGPASAGNIGQNDDLSFCPGVAPKQRGLHC